MPTGGRNFAHSSFDMTFGVKEDGERVSFMREMRIVGYKEVEELWRRFEVM